MGEWEQVAQHDHTPGYTERLGAPLGSTVRVRLRTTLPVQGVALKVVQVGEIETFPAREVSGRAGPGRWFEAELPLHDARAAADFAKQVELVRL